MKKKVIEVLSVIFGVILMLVPSVIAPVCDVKADGTHMGCYYSGNLTMYLGGAIVVISIIMIILKSKIYIILSSIANIILAFLVYAVPHQIIHVKNSMGKDYGYCSMPSMACREHHTFEIAGILALIIGILMIVNLIKLFLINNNEAGDNERKAKH